MNLSQLVLFPFSCLYGFIVFVRNKFFDWNIQPSAEYDNAIISVGNLSTGGTGKTPHVEYIIRLLQNDYSLATLSRGYKRKTKGFLQASKDSTYHDIGDEPLQYSQKFSDINVAVDECRRRGIESINSQNPDLDVIILDDAFQHRYVKPGLSILTTDFHNLYVEDYCLPSGTLRESKRGAKRADVIIVTKSPRVLSPITRRRITELIKPRAYQELLFTYLDYSEPIPLSKEQPDILHKKYSSILMITGIANSYPFASA